LEKVAFGYLISARYGYGFMKGEYDLILKREKRAEDEEIAGKV